LYVERKEGPSKNDRYFNAQGRKDPYYMYNPRETAKAHHTKNGWVEVKFKQPVPESKNSSYWRTYGEKVYINKELPHFLLQSVPN
jgi:hypothetical protein